MTWKMQQVFLTNPNHSQKNSKINSKVVALLRCLKGFDCLRIVTGQSENIFHHKNLHVPIQFNPLPSLQLYGSPGKKCASNNYYPQCSYPNFYVVIILICVTCI